MLEGGCLGKSMADREEIENFFFFFDCTACGILVPQPGIKPVPRVVEMQSPNHWPAKEVPK